MISREVGSGGEAVIYKGYLKKGDSTTARSVAVKFFFKKDAVAPEYSAVGSFVLDRKAFVGDLSKSLTFLGGSALYFVCMPYFPCKNLNKFLADRTSMLPFENVLELAIFITNQLVKLARSGLIYTDLKPPNTLADGRLVDLACVRSVGHESSEPLGTELFTSYLLMQQFMHESKFIVLEWMQLPMLALLFLSLHSGLGECSAIKSTDDCEVTYGLRYSVKFNRLGEPFLNLIARMMFYGKDMAAHFGTFAAVLECLSQIKTGEYKHGECWSSEDQAKAAATDYATLCKFFEPEPGPAPAPASPKLISRPPGGSHSP